MIVAYDMEKSWEHNRDQGPQLPDSVPPVPETAWKNFLGLPVRSRIGIAAGLLLNGNWIQAYARRGFDLLTYKTVRSQPRPCYPLPNWVFVHDTQPPDGPVYVTEIPPSDPTQISSSVCFGMPSVAPEIWRADVQATRAALNDGQRLLVSVVGTPSDDSSIDALADDFAQCAVWAAKAGADIVEANFSCPNVCSAEGTLFHDIASSKWVARRIRQAIPKTPLLIKIGTFPTGTDPALFLQTLNGVIDGVTLVNCISRPVLRHDGQPVFGPQYRSAGVLGRSIHEPSVAAVRLMRSLIDRDQLGLVVAAVGGVSTVQDFDDFFSAGAHAVLCGSSPMYLPDLAIEAKKAHPEW